MNNTNHLLLVLALLLLFSCNATNKDKSTENTESQLYDSLLASKLGADEYGMRIYVMAILKTGESKIEDSTRRDSLFNGHMKNMERLEKDGKLVVAGPFMNGGEYRGIFIFNAVTIEEAKALLETDPTIKAGILKADLIMWYGSAALLEVNKIHHKIAKKAVI